MYKTYPKHNGDGSFSKDEIKHGMVALYTDYECPKCGKIQSVAQMGGYGGDCIRCGFNINSTTTKEDKIMETPKPLLCSHKFILLDTKKYTEDAGYKTHWIRIDMFFCEKCLKKEVIKEDAYSREAPEWY